MHRVCVCASQLRAWPLLTGRFCVCVYVCVFAVKFSMKWTVGTPPAMQRAPWSMRWTML